MSKSTKTYKQRNTKPQAQQRALKYEKRFKGSLPKKQKPNAKCACGAGKKFKKCCKKKVMEETRPIYRIADEMTPFKHYLLGDEVEWDANPATNKNLEMSFRQACNMKERYKNPSFRSSHPKYCEPANIMRFMNARKGQVHQLQNNPDGWYSHCFQNAFFYAQWVSRKQLYFGEDGAKVRIGWLLTQCQPGVDMKVDEDFITKMAGKKQTHQAHMKGQDNSFAAELHLIVEMPDGTLYDPTPDYDPTIDVKLWVNDPQLQMMVDTIEGKGYSTYSNMIGTIQDFTPGGSGFLHKYNMDDWHCPLIMMGF